MRAQKKPSDHRPKYDPLEEEHDYHHFYALYLLSSSPYVGTLGRMLEFSLGGLANEFIVYIFTVKFSSCIQVEPHEEPKTCRYLH